MWSQCGALDAEGFRAVITTGFATELSGIPLLMTGMPLAAAGPTSLITIGFATELPGTPLLMTGTFIALAPLLTPTPDGGLS